MSQELKDFLLIAIPLYPVVVIVLFGAWIFVRAKRSKKVDFRLKGLGVSLELQLDDNPSGASSCNKE